MQSFQDLHTVDLEDFKYSEVRIIGLQLVDPNSEEYKDAGRAFKVANDMKFFQIMHDVELLLQHNKGTVICMKSH